MSDDVGGKVVEDGPLASYWPIPNETEMTTHDWVVSNNTLLRLG